MCRTLSILVLWLPALAHCASIAPSGCKAKTPPPSGLTCGVRGPYDVSPQRDQQDGFATLGWVAGADTLQKCVDLCFGMGADPEYRGKYSNCLSFGFDKSKGLCQLKYLTSAEIFQPNKTSNTVVYDIDCFTCPSHCPQTSGTQLLPNGGFDLSPKYFGPWTVYSSDFSSYKSAFLTQPGHNSKTTFRCKVRAKSNGSPGKGCYIYNQVPTCGAAFYLATFDYSTQSVNKLNNYAVGSILKNCITMLDGVVEATGTWRTIGCIYKIGTGYDDNLFYLRASYPENSSRKNNVDVLFDNMRVSRLRDNLATIPGAPSLLRNGGFESGSKAPWNITTDGTPARIVSPGLSGSKYALFWTFGRKTSLIIDIVQTITTKPGTLYMLSFQFLRLQGKEPVASTFFVFLNDVNSGPAKNTTQLLIDTRSENKLVTVQYPFYAFAPITRMTINLATGGKGNVTFDNFSVKEISPF